MKTMSFIELDLKTNEPVVHDYFARFNQSDFVATSDLFSEQGSLKPPFEKVIKGRSAIAQYLEKEAFGMKVFPTYVKTTMIAQDCTQYQIKGKVKTNYFTVHTSWLININSIKEITFVEIQLLEKLDNLLAFKNYL